MPATTVTAPGKIILFGEHSVVYRQPAIAIPVNSLRARVVLSPLIGKPTSTIEIEAREINLFASIKKLPVQHAIRKAINDTISFLGVSSFPSFKIIISSTIPLASGLGSGAAVTVAIIRGVAQFLGHPITDENVNTIAFEIEKIHHGTPSGIDNTVITYQQPVYFVKDQLIERLLIRGRATLIIGDTGVKSSTAKVVGNLRERWVESPEQYENLFNQCGNIASRAKKLLLAGKIVEIGPLMNENHEYLKEMGVSSIGLDNLVTAAIASGAIGAKMSGAGWGGNMIALVEKDNIDTVQKSLLNAGATNVYQLSLGVV
jgi:mevalonate kinase